MDPVNVRCPKCGDRLARVDFHRYTNRHGVEMIAILYTHDNEKQKAVCVRRVPRGQTNDPSSRD